MAKSFVWSIRVSVVQHRSHGKDMPPEPITNLTYHVESDHALSIIEALEHILKVERGE